MQINNLAQKKPIILELLKNNGPAIPSTVSRQIGVPLLFTSALLSELVSDKSVKFTHLKIGGSPVYYILGQEEQLNEFSKHLQSREKEMFDILKKKLIVDEDKLTPVQRVALRNMKDFAIPMQLQIKATDSEIKNKIFWRFHTFSFEEANKKIKELLKQTKKPKKEVKKEAKIEKKEIQKEIEEKPEKEQKERKLEEPKLRAKRKTKTELKEKIYNYLRSKNLEIIKNIDEEDTICKITSKSEVGKINFLVVSKMKKRLNEADISLAYQQGLHYKMPVFLITSGNLTKKAQFYLDSLGNYIILAKI